MLTENSVLAQVTILPAANCINVRWDKQVLRDGEVIASVLHRCTYGAEQKEQFITDVGSTAQGYINAIGWE